MARFLLPKKLCDKLDSLVRNFWWKGNPEEKDNCWIAWESLTCSKEEGGMGFRNFRAFNEAILAKQGWRLIMNPQSYWAKLLKGIYFPNSSFLQAARGCHASWVWLSLLHGRVLLEKGLRWQAQDRASINFWEDGWIPTLEGFKVQLVRPHNSDIQ
ncbi:uncharacterized mitochondrial protein AtMg00310-like [Rhododendron vialii]|uniref:uncharacterized mitochondrial protein AtMg00310-like n=1 Tax=Rhododendron vialii TaxID=182163 RepID=UPI00265E8FE0|nr:uncharacterized mitochondrial protein AtMg00310-like [Rhododendron vialii]